MSLVGRPAQYVHMFALRRNLTKGREAAWIWRKAKEPKIPKIWQMSFVTVPPPVWAIINGTGRVFFTDALQ